MTTSAVANPSLARELMALSKPRITTLVVFTTACGFGLAPVSMGWARIALTLVGTVLVVAAANALNMYLERDTDALMSRTKDRPLPAGRLEPKIALRFGVGLAALSVPLLTLTVGALPGLLASVALISYVLLYTPMKRYSTASLLVGAIPGAIPPLIGWTAATGHLELPGVLLFALMFLWQVPHFLAITLFRKEEYARAGLVVAPNQPGGERTARADIVRYTVALWGTSLLFVPIGAAGRVYFVVAVVCGAAFTGLGVMGLKAGSGPKWAKQLFLLSLVYLTAVMAALVLDRGGLG